MTTLARRLKSSARIVGLVLAGLLTIILIVLALAYQLMLPVVQDRVSAAPARPVLSYASVSAWEADRPRLLQAFSDHVYGRPPPLQPVSVIQRKVIPADFMTDRAHVEQWTLLIGPGTAALPLYVLVVTPTVPGPWPAILMPTFCGNRASMPEQGEAVDVSPTMPAECQGGMISDLVAPLIFGRNASVPPMLEIVKRGYALVTYYPGDIVPDSAAAAPAALRRLDPEATDAQRGGALAAWAWGNSRVLDAVDTDSRFDPTRTAVWGHSRHGKAALLSAAIDSRFEAVFSHQSGRGGASLSSNLVGERVSQITSAYPHWFGAGYATFAGREDILPVDQHQLIALAAPRAVLIGAGERDAWADPQGAFRALEGAAPIWRLYGRAGLVQRSIREPVDRGELAMFMRAGRHGIYSSDWGQFLSFLDQAWLSRSDEAKKRIS